MSYQHQGRKITVDDQYPGYYVALFSDEYDSAIDSRHPVGMGKTEGEAVADLISQDEERHAATSEHAASHKEGA